MTPIEIIRGDRVINSGEVLRMYHLSPGMKMIRSTSEGTVCPGDTGDFPHECLNEPGYYLVDGVLMRVYSENSEKESTP